MPAPARGQKVQVGLREARVAWLGQPTPSVIDHLAKITIALSIVRACSVEYLR